MAEVGYASLAIIPSFDGFERRLESGTRPGLTGAGTKGGVVFGDAAGKSAGKRFGSIFSSAAKASLIGLAGAGALAFKLGKDAVSSASDLEESTNKVRQIFGDQADSIFKFTSKAADGLGQSDTAARDAAATFGIFANAAEMGDRSSAKFSKRMTRLASDLASFHNTEPEEAVQALSAALRGEAEPIRSYGVLLDDATLKAEALRLGLLEPVKDEAKIKAYQVRIIEQQKAYNEAVAEYGPKSLEALKAEANLGTSREALRKATEGTIPALTQQQKVIAAQSEIFKQTETAQGDFARTSDGLANQQRRLSARFEDAKAKLGQGLLPIMTDAADWLLDKGIPAFEDFADWFTKDGIPALEEFGGWVEDEIFPILKDLKEFAKDAGRELGDMIEFINDLPKPAKYAGLVALLGGAAALKARGGSGGALGGAGRALGLAAPVPVRVMNWQGGGSGGGVFGSEGKGKGRFGGRGNTLGTVIASILGPEIIDEAWKEFKWPFEEGPLKGTVFEDMSGPTAKEREEHLKTMAGLFGETEAASKRATNHIASDAERLRRKSLKPLTEDVNEFDRSLRTIPGLKRLRVEVLGVQEAQRQVEVALAPFMVGRNAAKEAQGADAMLPAPSRGRAGVTVVQNIGTVNDSKQLNKDAAAKAQQAAMGGWG